MPRAKPLPPLPAGTESYTDSAGYKMIWVKAASERYGLPLWVFDLPRFIKSLHSVIRDVPNQRWKSTGRRPRRFIRQLECPKLETWWRHLQKSQRWAVEARARGLKPAREVARALGRTDVNVRTWCRSGCGYLPDGAKPIHQFQPGTPRRLWISDESERAIKAAMNSSALRHAPPRPSRIDRPDGPYISAGEAKRRTGYSYESLHRFASGETSVPGGGKFRRWPTDKHNAKGFYHEGDVDALPTKTKRRGRELAQPRVTKAGRTMPTRLVAALCGRSPLVVRAWGTGRTLTPGRLPFRDEPLLDNGFKLHSWNAADAVAIARHLGRPIPPEYDKDFPTPPAPAANGNGDPTPKAEKPKGRRGRRRLSSDAADARLRRLARWETAKAAGTLKADFCNHEKINPETLDRDISWAAMRRLRGL